MTKKTKEKKRKRKKKERKTRSGESIPRDISPSIDLYVLAHTFLIRVSFLTSFSPASFYLSFRHTFLSYYLVVARRSLIEKKLVRWRQESSSRDTIYDIFQTNDDNSRFTSVKLYSLRRVNDVSSFRRIDDYSRYMSLERGYTMVSLIDGTRGR